MKQICFFLINLKQPIAERCFSGGCLSVDRNIFSAGKRVDPVIDPDKPGEFFGDNPISRTIGFPVNFAVPGDFSVQRLPGGGFIVKDGYRCFQILQFFFQALEGSVFFRRKEKNGSQCLVGERGAERQPVKTVSDWFRQNIIDD